MSPPAVRLPIPPGTDPQLRAFLEADTDAEAACALARLMEGTIAPVVDAHLGRRTSRGNVSDAEDIASEARSQLAIHLQNLRAAPADRAPIADLRAYAATVASSAWAANLRQRHPARAALHNRLRYLLENRTRDRGFARWDSSGGESLAGFAAWRGTLPDPSNARHQQLRAEPHTALAIVFGAGKSGGASLPLAEQVAGLLAWLGGPLPLRELIDALAELGQADAGPAPPTDHGAGADPSPGDSAGLAVADPLPSPHDALRWKEYLAWLWQEVARLTLRQRRAFLLHSHCLREMELLGLTGVRQTAALLGVPPERMAEYWNALPLEDRVIAALLGVEGQQVINLRKAARASLFRAWSAWLDEK